MNVCNLEEVKKFEQSGNGWNVVLNEKEERDEVRSLNILGRHIKSIFPRSDIAKIQALIRMERTLHPEIEEKARVAVEKLILQYPFGTIFFNYLMLNNNAVLLYFEFACMRMNVALALSERGFFSLIVLPAETTLPFSHFNTLNYIADHWLIFDASKKQVLPKEKIKKRRRMETQQVIYVPPNYVFFWRNYANNLRKQLVLPKKSTQTE